MKRGIFAWILTLCMALILLPAAALAADGADTWDGSADTSWYTEPSTTNTYTITTAAQLAGLAQLVNDGNSFSGKTVKLGADIDLAGKEWTPIGKSGAMFQGTFDGGENTISNLKISSEESYVGLF